jgi:hypothetical protein
VGIPHVTLLLSLVLSGFPVVLDAGASVPLEGRTPRLTMVAGRPTLVWVDGRRRWLDGRDAGQLYVVELPTDGGVAPSVGARLARGLDVPAINGLVVAGGANGALLAMFETFDRSSAFSPQFVVGRPGMTVFGAGPSSPTTVQPLAATWSGAQGMGGWVQDGGVVLSWFTPTGLANQFPLSERVSSMAMGSEVNAGVFLLRLAGTDVRLGLVPAGSQVIQIRGQFTGQSTSRLAIEPNGRALLKHDSTTTVYDPGTVQTHGLAGFAPLLDQPSLAMPQPSNQPVIGLVTSATALGGVVLFTRDAGVPRLDLDARALSLLAVGNEVLAVSEDRSTQVLSLRTVTAHDAGRLDVQELDAMRRSPAIVWAGDRWVVAWEQGSSASIATRVLEVLTDGTVRDLFLDADRGRPRLSRRSDDGGVLLHVLAGDSMGTYRLDGRPPGPATLELGSSFAGEAVATDQLTVHWDATPATWNALTRGGPITSGTFPSFRPEAASGLGDRVWFLGRDDGGWTTRQLQAPGTLVSRSEPLPGPTPDALTPTSSVISVRRLANGAMVALVGVRVDTTLRWSLVRSDGGVNTVTTVPGRQGMAVTARATDWVVAELDTSSVLTLKLVNDTGASNQQSFLALPQVELGIPVLAAEPAGTVAMATPFLLDGQPRLRVDVLFVADAGAGALDGGVVDGGITTLDGGNVVEPDDAGTVDAGAQVDAGLGSDAGTSRDAGAQVDAGDPRDAGAALVDAGTSPDAGAADGGQPLLFVPTGCGCAGVDASLLPVALMLLVARRRRGPRSR